MITRDEELRQAVKALHVANRIEIVLGMKYAECVGEVENFAQEVATRKRWSVEKKPELKSNVGDGGKSGIGKLRRRAIGERSKNYGSSMWVLRPIVKGGSA